MRNYFGVQIESLEETFAGGPTLTGVEMLPISPGLYLGLGGSGHRIGLFLKAALLRAYPEGIPSAFRILVFDTDDEHLAVRVGDRLVTLERESEFFHIGQVPVARIVRNLDKLPSIAERLPYIRDLPPVALRRGAKQLRPLGLLALLWHYPRMQEIVQNALWALAGRENLGDESLRVDPAQGITIFLAGSLVGGTHSGQMLDVAYLIRSELERLGSLADFCRIIGVGLLPGAFRGIDGPNLVPNTLAALRELNHCMVQGSFQATYRNGQVVDTAQPPFDMYYLVDAVDEEGQTWLSLEDLCTMVAQSIFLMTGSRLGQRGESAFDNLDDVLSASTPEGFGTFFGSLGLAELRFPAEEVMGLCRARHARRIIRQGLLRPSDEERIAQAVEAYIHSHTLSADPLLKELAVDEEGLPIAVVLDPPGWLEDFPPHRIPQEVLQWVQNYRLLWLEEISASVSRLI